MMTLLCIGCLIFILLCIDVSCIYSVLCRMQLVRSVLSRAMRFVINARLTFACASVARNALLCACVILWFIVLL